MERFGETENFELDWLDCIGCAFPEGFRPVSTMVVIDYHTYCSMT